MKKLLFILVVCLLSTSVFAEGNNEKDIPFVLNGLVIDSQTNEPMAGVEVIIAETGDKVYTDFDGKFSYNTSRNGSYHLNFSMISYDDKKMQFSAEQNNLTVKL